MVSAVSGISIARGVSPSAIDTARAAHFRALLEEAAPSAAIGRERPRPDYSLLLSTVEEMMEAAAMERYVRTGGGRVPNRNQSPAPQPEVAWSDRSISPELLAELIQRMGGAERPSGKGMHVDVRV